MLHLREILMCRRGSIGRSRDTAASPRESRDQLRRLGQLHHTRLALALARGTHMVDMQHIATGRCLDRLLGLAASHHHLRIVRLGTGAAHEAVVCRLQFPVLLLPHQQLLRAGAARGKGRSVRGTAWRASHLLKQINLFQLAWLSRCTQVGRWQRRRHCLSAGQCHRFLVTSVEERTRQCPASSTTSSSSCSGTHLSSSSRRRHDSGDVGLCLRLIVALVPGQRPAIRLTMGARPDLLLQRELQLQVVGIGCVWVSLLGERNEVGGNTVWSEGEKEEGRRLGTCRI